MSEQAKTMRKLLSELDAEWCVAEDAWADAGCPEGGELWDAYREARAQYKGAESMAQALGL